MIAGISNVNIYLGEKLVKMDINPEIWPWKHVYLGYSAIMI